MSTWIVTAGFPGPAAITPWGGTELFNASCPTVGQQWQAHKEGARVKDPHSWGTKEPGPTWMGAQLQEGLEWGDMRQGPQDFLKLSSAVVHNLWHVSEPPDEFISDADIWAPYLEADLPSLGQDLESVL